MVVAEVASPAVAASTILSSLLTHPLHRVRALMAVSGELHAQNKADILAVCSPSACAQWQFKQGGVESIWHGALDSIALGLVPSLLLRPIIESLCMPAADASPATRIGLALAQSLLHLSLTYPLSLCALKTTQDVPVNGHYRYTSGFHALREAFSAGVESAVPRLYRGLGLSVAGVLVYRLSYAGMLSLMPSRIGPANTFLTAIAAGMLAYPLDVLRRRYIALDPVDMRSSWQYARDMIRSEGFQAFYFGNMMAMVENLSNRIALMQIYPLVARTRTFGGLSS
ncbi:uncharacterized protein MONBRDRAFT_10130 [Monosiga brevicollis MX1]|uniref:ADP/ATP translocase n=1 Tax=Monosiga brevicollis TaxID=81824 RepID=A9V5B0_MONBE|nr:uncharacterized protein MONBRDRAFT_10130 [Monosiga brevicollis MX1]EDQ87247.1 predicted protein [Monosiga brevicollis MX1]|eukprot:XP_001747860.1 hypothetical protein [Monosiga brevicollis MX1]